MLALIWGGSASGKSELAERAALALNPGPGPVAYVATMEGNGAEAQARIRRHRAMRDPARFVTVEQPHGLDKLTLPTGVRCGLLECLGNLLANERYALDQPFETAREAAFAGIRHLEEQVQWLVVVGNDVFRDGDDYDPETLDYIRALGELTQAVSYRAALQVEAVCGLPVIHRGRELWTQWEE